MRIENLTPSKRYVWLTQAETDLLKLIVEHVDVPNGARSLTVMQILALSDLAYNLYDAVQPVLESVTICTDWK